MFYFTTSIGMATRIEVRVIEKKGKRKQESGTPQ